MATIYVWPGAAFNGDGTLPTQAASGGAPGARNVPGALAINNTYRFKRGTTYANSGGVRPISLVSSAATPLTFEAYANDDGSDDPTQPLPTIDHLGGSNGTGAIFIDQCQNVIVRNLRGTNSTAATCAGIKVRSGANVLVEKCQTDGNIHGIDVTAAAVVFAMADITVRQNTTFNNQGSGIRFEFGSAIGQNMRRLTISANKVFGNGTGGSANRRGGIMHQCSIADGAGNALSHTTDYACFGLVIEDNQVFANRSYAIAAYCIHPDTVGNRKSRISGNQVYGNGWDGTLDAHCIWLGGSRGVLVERNDVHDNIGAVGLSIGSSVGVFIDLNANGSAVQPTGGDHVVRRNRCYSGWKGNTAAAVPGSGIHVLSNENCIVESNLVFDCMNGVSVSGSGTANNTVRHNTLVGLKVGSAPVNNTGRGVTITNGANTIIENNIIVGAQLDGVHISTSGPTGTVERNNLVFDCVTPRSNGTVASPTPTALDATDLTVDPQLGPDYLLTPASPAIRAGRAASARRDLRGALRPATPSIGAYDVARVRARL